MQYDQNNEIKYYGVKKYPIIKKVEKNNVNNLLKIIDIFYFCRSLNIL